MNNQNSFFNDNNPMKFLEDLTQQRNKELRQMFKSFMKSNVMIRVKEEIINSPQFAAIIPSVYNVQLSTISGFGAEDVDYDICCNLALINYYLQLSLSEEEKGKLYNSSEYIDDLKARTIKHIQLRRCMNTYLEKYSLLAHTPLNYSIHCVSNYLLSRINEHLRNKNRSQLPNANFKINSIIVMLKNISSLLLLTESDNCGSAFSLLRALIETFFVYQAIDQNESVANEYYKFMQFREDYEATGSYPQEFVNILPQNIYSKHNYLNYGWFDALDNKKHRYTFDELVSYSAIKTPGYREAYLMA